MDKAMLFWFIMFVILIFGGWGFYPAERRSLAPFGGLLFIAIAILGWQVFGNAIK